MFDFLTIFSGFQAGLLEVISVQAFLMMVIGVIVGICIGVLPGLSPSIGVALMLPLSFYLSPTNALILLVSVYLSSNYGGSITAITINTPGTPGAVATTFDGYELTKQGKPGLALGTSIFASTVGGIVGTVILILFTRPLALIALRFESYEYFALGVFGLTIISTLSSKNVLKGFISSALGLLLVTVGFDLQLSFSRFSFGWSELQDGISFIPALIGLFALGEIFYSIERSTKEKLGKQVFSKEVPSFRDYWKMKKVILKSSFIGTLVGSIPGAGGTIATFIAYNEAKRSSKESDKFGKGSLEGVAAPEAANNGSVGGALIPLLSLGIPGSASTAVLLGALMIHRITPGPNLFQPKADGGHPEIVYGLFISLFIANIIMYILGRFGNRLWIKITEVSKTVIFPIIIALSIVGSYFLENSMVDVVFCFVFGFIGWMLRRNDFPTAPVVLGLILGKMIEENLRLSLVRGPMTDFLSRPISLTILFLAIVSFVWPFIKIKKKTRRADGGVV